MRLKNSIWSVGLGQSSTDTDILVCRHTCLVFEKKLIFFNRYSSKFWSKWSTMFHSQLVASLFILAVMHYSFLNVYQIVRLICLNLYVWIKLKSFSEEIFVLDFSKTSSWWHWGKKICWIQVKTAFHCKLMSIKISCRINVTSSCNNHATHNNIW